ncbi:hypothetical protein Tco_0268807 [Tanacetum coccineum]
MVFNSPCLTDKKELIHHEVEMVINSPWIMPLLGTKGLASPEQTATVGLFNKATKTANYMVLEGVLMKNKDAASSRDIQLICAEFSSIQVKTQADWMLLQSSYFNPQVPTGRVVVPTGRYVVPAGKVIIIVSPGRLSLVPTGRVLSPGSDNESDDASVHSEATIAQQQQNIQPQIITTVSNNNAKFPYLKKDEYEVWAMKMEYWITNNDMNIWKVIQNGNSLKRTGRDRDGRVIILPPTTADEHIAVQRESKARTTLLQSIPDDHVVDFHYMDDARDIWNAVKARFGGNAKSKKIRKSMLKKEFSEFRISEAEGLHKGYDRIQKVLSQLNQLKAKPEDEDINLKFLRALPSSWSQVALTLKTKGLSHSAFVSTTSASKKMSYADSPSYSLSTYTALSNSKTGSYRSGNVIKDVLQSFPIGWVRLPSICVIIGADGYAYPAVMLRLFAYIHCHIALLSTVEILAQLLGLRLRSIPWEISCEGLLACRLILVVGCFGLSLDYGPLRRQPQVRQTSVESSNLEKPDNPPIVTMADNRTMAQLLEDTTEVTRNAIVIPEITANNFEIKHVFLILSKQAIFWPMIKKTTCSNPFISTRYFYDEDSEVPNSSVKLMLFSFSLDRGSPDLAGKRTPSDD